MYTLEEIKNFINKNNNPETYLEAIDTPEGLEVNCYNLAAEEMTFVGTICKDLNVKSYGAITPYQPEEDINSIEDEVAYLLNNLKDIRAEIIDEEVMKFNSIKEFLVSNNMNFYPIVTTFGVTHE